MFSFGVRKLYGRSLRKCSMLQGKQVERRIGNSVYLTTTSFDDDNKNDAGKMTLSQSLALLVSESSTTEETTPKTRWELKRSFEHRIKKRVKDQFCNGKFHDLLVNVIAHPSTLRDAYNSIRVNSNVDLAKECNDIDFCSVAKELSSGKFDVNAHVYSISTRGVNKEGLMLPKLELNVVQEAIRIALEVVYKPHYSKISHGCRSGRDHSSASRYVRKEFSNSDFWFTLLLNHKFDARVLVNLTSIMENKIVDPSLYALIREMFEANVLNLEFGRFAKGHGLPQEGVLSPVLMNIYLDILDRELSRMSIRYEAFEAKDDIANYDGSHSKLRSWFRKQIDGCDNAQNGVKKSLGLRVHACRFMDEIFVGISGSKEDATYFKAKIETFIQNSLNLDLDKGDILQCNDIRGVCFLGSLVRRRQRVSPRVKAIHKLKEKVELFALQKRELWDDMMIRIGKKCLGHGLKKVKESEIKHLADSSSFLCSISQFRKSGMKTDHWYKVLLKIWMQLNSEFTDTEESMLSKYLAEPALPQELRDSFMTFQNLTKEYVSAETVSTLALLPESNFPPVYVTEIVAPVDAIKKRLLRYGLTNSKGQPRACHFLVLHDCDQIIDWFSGLVLRWVRWYQHCDNFNEISVIFSEQVKKSCIRTLAVKYRMHELEIEKKFDSELSRIPLNCDMENDTIKVDINSLDSIHDKALAYGMCYSGLFLLSLTRMVSQARPCRCFVVGCVDDAPSVYTVRVMERQRFPGWKTGFSTCIHPSLHGRRIGLCKQHLKDMYLGRISLQSVNFGAWK